MSKTISLELKDNELYFPFEGRSYKIEYCCQCQCFIIKCLEDVCDGASCNGMGCEECVPAFYAFYETVGGPLTDILCKEFLERRKQEKQATIDGHRFTSFFDMIGVDWENGERPKGWNS